MKNSDNIFNINIMLNDQNDKQSMPYSKNMRKRVPCKNSVANNSNLFFSNNSNIANGTGSSNLVMNNSNYIDNNKICYEDVPYNNNSSGYNNNRGYGGSGQNNEYNAQQPSNRIYSPIDYKLHYRGDARHRPNVCSYGTKQIVQPTFLNSSTLFQGTDLKEASENTQVGSIMPKFEYYEYEDPL